MNDYVILSKNQIEICQIRGKKGPNHDPLSNLGDHYLKLSIDLCESIENCQKLRYFVNEIQK